MPVRLIGKFSASLYPFRQSKSVWQYYTPTRDVLLLLELFRRTVSDTIKIGLAYDATSLRRLTPLTACSLITILSAITSSASYLERRGY
ncbi:hypothetical protein E6H34_06905 [Candidatus Bathyarchaeota archaeon]|nr:MAG: hypothetical protein E6H34_06905 [Candidatus Bathyarchaeota archaeon]